MARAAARSILLAIVALAAVVVSAAHAGDRPAPFRVTSIGRFPFPERGYLIDLAQSRAIAPSKVHVSENGVRVGSILFAPIGASGLRYGTILAIDASDSMAGLPESAAIAAARTFVAKSGANERIGVVTFNSSAHVLDAPSADTAHVRASLAGATKLGYGTHIYDALQQSLQLLARDKIAAGSIVLLSDGADVGSAATLDQVVATAAAHRVRIFTVGLRSKAFDGSVLRSIARQTDATYAEAAQPAEIASIYGSLGSKLAGQYVLQYRSAAAPKTAVSVAIGIDDVGSASTAYDSPTPSNLAPFHRPFIRRFFLSWGSLILIALLVAGLFAFAVRLALLAGGSRMVRRVRAFSGEAPTPAAELRHAAGEEWRRRANRARASGSIRLGRLEEQLEIGRVRISAQALVALTIAATVVAIVVLAAVSPILALAGFGTPLLARGYVKRRVRRIRDDFADQLPPNLQVLASALRAGHTLAGALATTVESSEEPSRTELSRIVADERLGMPLDTAIRRVAARMSNRDLEQVAVLAELQRTTGGNAAEVLDVIVATVRERADVRRLVKTLTAQGRMGRWILTGLPIGTGLAFYALQPDLVGPMWASSGGQIALLVAGTMVVAGSLVIQRIIDIEV